MEMEMEMERERERKRARVYVSERETHAAGRHRRVGVYEGVTHVRAMPWGKIPTRLACSYKE